MRKFFVTLFLLFSIFASGQTGYISINDFGPPTYPYNHTRFWLRGSVPAGSNPVTEFFGINSIKFYQDSVYWPKLALRDDANPYKLMWVDNNGVFKAITPPYLNITDTTGKWLPIGTVIPGAQVNSDWSSVTGVSQILNKPTTLAGYGITDPIVVTTGSYSNPSWITSLGWSKITSTPTTLSGYGITDPVVVTSGSYANPSWITSLASSKITWPGTTAQYIRGDGSAATLNTSVVPESGNLYFTDARARGAISLTTTGTNGVATYNSGSGVLNIPNYSTATFYNNGSVASNSKVLTFTGVVAGGAGNVIFYLTDNGLVGGNALYTNVNFVVPIVNDASTNYTYAWTISGDKKTLTINTKSTPAINVALLSLTLLGVPANAANGTGVTALVVGN